MVWGCRRRDNAEDIILIKEIVRGTIIKRKTNGKGMI